MQDKHGSQTSPTAKTFRLALISLILMAPLFFNPTYRASASADVPERPGTKVFIPSLILGNSSNVGDTGGTVDTPAPDWLNYLNSFRAMSSLPPVSENASWSTGGLAHSRYTVKNDILQHNEDTRNPWYTPEGLSAAQSGNLMGSSDSAASDLHAIDAWMQAPFHAVGILDPKLKQVGYGSYREKDGGLQMGATLDVLRGLGALPLSIHFPIEWPGPGSTTPIGSYWGETPDPLTSCPGYTAPAGLPVVLQVGDGSLSPVVTGYSFSKDGATLESCVFTETTYSNPNADAQNVGRAVLAARDAVVLIPRQPLERGVTYTVSITVSGQTYSWSFTVSTNAIMSNIMTP